MDFVGIRKKAKERAAARARAATGRASAREPGREPPEPGPPPATPPPPDTVVTDADVLEGKLMAELQGAAVPPPPAEAPRVAGEDEFLIAARGRPPAGRREGAERLAGGSTAGAASGRAPEAGAGPPAGPLDEFFFREDEPGSPVLDHGLVAAEPPAAPEAPEPRREYLGFFLGDEEYALEIATVREILRAPVITEVPRGPQDVLGVVTVRGEVMPVVDPRRRLALPARPAGAGHRVVVCRLGDASVGLLVDRVSQVVRLPPSAIEARPQGVGGAEPGTIVGIGRDRDRLFIILEPAALLGAGAPRELPA